eukprot:TRINITY_DN20461_c0_g1_i1.p1 TRINITY_DN20461_c0_g1~~TRINITY_DN20461_c0_g1_i1.p1  ORF type:complete len:720 (+),score=163.21 TRINITY_DN20461_c0_g1_i1:84-2243(+)
MGAPLLHNVIGKFAPHHRLIASAAYLAALVLVCIFPSFDRRTEIEEHGLVPGYANSGFYGDWPARLSRTIARIEASRSPEAVEAALEAALVEAQLISHRANFTVPGARDSGRTSSYLYTVANARRGDAREAAVVVVATNWTASRKACARASLGLGIGVTLAAFMRTVPWLSKDVFVVFVDGSLPYGAGTRAWLRDYFGGHTAVRRGVLRQAVVLDTASGVHNVLVEAEGINGMVPNQDHVNAFMVAVRDHDGVTALHRGVWQSVFHHLRNGGVHSGHAPFLEAQLPAFTIKGRRQQAGQRGSKLDPAALLRTMEGHLRSMSNNLQQLHHSFNFYFFTAEYRHISSGLYLYPVFAMQLPLLSFLLTAPAYRDVRSLLVGLGSVVAVVVAAGCPAFFLATDPTLGRAAGAWLSAAVSSGASAGSRSSAIAAAAADVFGRPPACERELPAGAGEAAALWLGSSAVSAATVGFVLRWYAFRVFSADASDAAAAKSTSGGVRLPAPLWEAVRAASGFVYLVALASTTIYAWALAMPLTVVAVPMLVLARPVSLRRRPVRSAVLLGFLALHALPLVPPARRAELLGSVPADLVERGWMSYHNAVRSVPREALNYMPTRLVNWLYEGELQTALSGDLLEGLYRAARDYHCVGGMLFPVFCFVYFPFLVLIGIVGFLLPAQLVDDSGLTLAQMRLLALAMLTMLGACFVGGVVWRSYSSAGLGKLEW